MDTFQTSLYTCISRHTKEHFNVNIQIAICTQNNDVQTSNVQVIISVLSQIRISTDRRSHTC